MADIKAYRKKHYSGLDADKANVTGAVGDSYAANDSGKQYYWNDSLNAWKTGLGYEYVPRPSTGPDKVIGDFTCDGAAHADGVDLSGIVPAGAVAVVLEIYIQATAATEYFTVYQNFTHTYERVMARVQVANQFTDGNCSPVACDADRLFDYRGSVNVNHADLTVRGWYI